MPFLKNDVVRHPSRPEWGLGKVLADCDESSVHVFFVGAGEKTLKQDLAQLVKVPASESGNALLQNLKVAKSGKPIGFQSLPTLIRKFERQFPGGFSGDAYFKEEREYKLAAHSLMKELLDESGFQSLLENRDDEEISKRARAVVNKTNLIFPNEKMALKDGLESGANAEAFSRALFSLIYGKEGMQQRFERFSDCLEALGAAKWTTATYFLFVRFPQDHMFMKPEVTQEAAKVCNFDLSYKAELNWATYEKLMAFSRYLFHELTANGLPPVDMIDVQSFIWCTGEFNG
jgi:hypothetical protein